MKFDPDTIRARFHELSAKVSKLHEEMDPLRDELADIVAGKSDLSLSAARAREAEIRAKVKAVQPEFARIEAERATCARALGGRTGPLQADAAHLAKGSAMANGSGPGEDIPPRRIEEGDHVLFYDGDERERGSIVSVDHETDNQLARILIESDQRTETDVPFAWGEFQPDRGYVYNSEIGDGGPLG